MGTAKACFNCRHYYVTWDPASPYGCRAHGFKSPRNPALIVFESSGLQCQLFENKFMRGMDKKEATGCADRK